jgi:hypothetical protein
MRYSQIESERTSDKIAVNEEENDVRFVEEEEEITDKIPIQTFCQINNAPVIFDDPLSIVRLVLLKAKPEYSGYFGNSVYAVYVRTENNEAWFGQPVKNPSVGLMRWDKNRWDKLYGFVLSLSMQEDVM